MNTETIKIFCDLVELKNFSQTAQAHGVSQSAISQQLAQLETSQKCQLINRKTRPISLTPAGECYYKACKDVLKRCKQLETELVAIGGSSPEIKLAAIYSIGIAGLQPYIKRFIAQYPAVKLTVEYQRSEDIYQGLLTGVIDIGIVACPAKERHLDILPFESEPLVLVCSPENPLSQFSKIDIRKLQGQKFISLGDCPTGTFLDGILARYNVTVERVMEIANIETLKRAVELDMGAAILTEPAVRTESLSGSLVTSHFTNENFARPAGVIVNKKSKLDHAGRHLVELLQKTQAFGLSE